MASPTNPGARRRRLARPKPLVEVLAKQYPAPEQWPMIRAFQAWERGLPRRVVRNARPVSLDRGVLTVHVTSPMWSQELSYLAPTILERIAKEPGTASVRSMRFRVAPLPAPIPLVHQHVDPFLPALPSVERDPVLEAALTTVADDGLRAIIDSASKASRGRRALEAKRARGR